MSHEAMQMSREQHMKCVFICSLVMQTSLLLSIIYYFLRGGERGRLDSDSQLLTIGYFYSFYRTILILEKYHPNGIVNWVFFTSAER